MRDACAVARRQTRYQRRNQRWGEGTPRRRLDRTIKVLLSNLQLVSRLREKRQPLLEPVFGMGLGKLGDEGLRGDERNGVSRQDRGPANGHREMGLAHAWRTEQQKRFGIGDKAAGRELLHLRL